MHPLIVMAICFLQGMTIWAMTMRKVTVKPLWFTLAILLFAGIDVAMVQTWPVITAALTIGSLFIFGMLVADDLNKIIKIFPTVGHRRHPLRPTIR